MFLIKRENKVLKESIKQLNQQLANKTQEVEQLQKQIFEKELELYEIEKRIKILKQKRENINIPKNKEEIVKEFKELGYNATIK